MITVLRRKRPEIGAGELPRAPLPTDAPAYFKQAFQQARADSRPILIDFQAAWCAPCKRLKKETLGHPDVIRALAEFTVIEVDLDADPGLAKAYGVASIPDLFLIDHQGRIVDRLRQFEPATPFLKRLQKLEHRPLKEPATRGASPDGPLKN